jgi:hypothetical protein
MVLSLGSALNAKLLMASQHRKYRGFATERLVADYLSSVWEFASVGRGKGKDIQNVPFDCEVKARAGFQPKAVLAQIKARTVTSGELGFAVLRLNGQGEDVREYAAIIRFEDLLELLKIKYAHIDIQPTEADIERCSGCGSYMIRRCLTCQPTTTDVQPAILVRKSIMDSTIDQ